MSSKVWRTRSSQSSSRAIRKLYPRFQSFLVYEVFVLFVPSGPDYITIAEQENINPEQTYRSLLIGQT